MTVIPFGRLTIAHETPRGDKTELRVTDTDTVVEFRRPHFAITEHVEPARETPWLIFTPFWWLK